MEIICDVVVLTFNKLELTKKFVESFLSATKEPCRLIIIDNNSSDGSQDYLRSLKNTGNCEFRVILNDENKGFVRGMNQGIDSAAAPYVCIANNDLLFAPGWLSIITALFRKHPEIGLINPNSNNFGERLMPGESLSGRGKFLSDRFSSDFVEMPFCVGFCMVIRRGLLKILGGFSEEFVPMFFEDTDYSLRAVKAGFLIGMARGAYVWHQEHGSLGQIGGERRQIIFDRSKSVFIKKWGRILRIAWIRQDISSLEDDLSTARELVRNGNFVRIFFPGRPCPIEEVLKRNGGFENLGIDFVFFKNRLDLFWKIVTKKKKYDIVINVDFVSRLFLRLKGSKVISSVDREAIQQVKVADDTV